MYSLRSENLTHLGGAMGSEYTFDNYTKYFNERENASKYANKEYNKGRKKKKELGWIKTKGKEQYRTEDLGYVMYHIELVVVEDA